MSRSTKQPQSSPGQYVIDFQSELKERLALIRSLDCLVPDWYSSKQVSRVVEILTRVALKCYGDEWCQCATKSLGSSVGRVTVSERTIRNWVGLAEDIGVIQVDRLSHQYGRGELNRWRVDYRAIYDLTRELRIGPAVRRQLAGNRAEKIAAPTTLCLFNQNAAAPPTPSPIAASAPSSTAEQQQQRDLEIEVGKCGVRVARQCVAAALAAGCSADHIRAIIAAFKARRFPPGHLYQRLMQALPDFDPADGWQTPPPGAAAVITSPEQLARRAERERLKQRSTAAYALSRELRRQGFVMDALEQEMQKRGYSIEDINPVGLH